MPKQPISFRACSANQITLQQIWYYQRIEPNNGPLIVTKNMKEIGLNSTFLNGMFYLGAPPLSVRPNHSRQLNAQMSSLIQIHILKQLHPKWEHCSRTCINVRKIAAVHLIAAFPDKVSPATCQLLIDFMAQDKLGSLIQGGVPDGTLVPHKHGYVPASRMVLSVIQVMLALYTPPAEILYLSIYTYHPVNNIWDITNPLIGESDKSRIQLLQRDCGINKIPPEDNRHCQDDGHSPKQFSLAMTGKNGSFFHTSYIIQPMSASLGLYRLQQVDRQIDRARAQLETIRKTLENDAELREALKHVETTQADNHHANHSSEKCRSGSGCPENKNRTCRIQFVWRQGTKPKRITGSAKRYRFTKKISRPRWKNVNLKQ